MMHDSFIKGMMRMHITKRPITAIKLYSTKKLNSNNNVINNFIVSN